MAWERSDGCRTLHDRVGRCDDAPQKPRENSHATRTQTQEHARRHGREVYRARDAKLKREVALKSIPAKMSTDPERLARFEREARVLAALNHPHIAAIYGVEEADGARALVLELVEGPTLAERLRLGAIPVRDALVMARQIADTIVRCWRTNA